MELEQNSQEQTTSDLIPASPVVPAVAPMNDREMRRIKKWYKTQAGRFFEAHPEARWQDIGDHLLNLSTHDIPEDPSNLAKNFLDKKKAQNIAKGIMRAIERFERKRQARLAKAEKQTNHSISMNRGRYIDNALPRSRCAETDHRYALISAAKEKYGEKFVVHDYGMILPYDSCENLRKKKEHYASTRPKIVVTTFDRKIIDGKNELLIAAQLDLEVEFEEFKGEDALEFVMTRNVHRRHLSTSQKAMIGAKLLTTRHGTNRYTLESGIPDSTPPVTLSKASALAGAHEDTIAGAKEILDSGDKEIIESVSDGNMSVHAALRKLKHAGEPKEIVGILILDEKKAGKTLKGMGLPREDIPHVIDLMKKCGILKVKEYACRVLVEALEKEAAAMEGKAA